MRKRTHTLGLEFEFGMKATNSVMLFCHWVVDWAQVTLESLFKCFLGVGSQACTSCNVLSSPKQSGACSTHQCWNVKCLWTMCIRFICLPPLSLLWSPAFPVLCIIEPSFLINAKNLNSSHICTLEIFSVLLGLCDTKDAPETFVVKGFQFSCIAVWLLVHDSA